MHIIPHKKLFNETIKDPSRHFETPFEVIEDSRLTSTQKKKILDSWELDQKLLLTAEEENMASDDSKGRAHATKLIQDINDARKNLH